MQYHVSLPANWSPNKKWPILVTLDGSNSEFLHNNQTFAQARGSKPFIIVTPFIVSNTGKSTDYSKYNYSSAVWDEIKNEGTIRFDEQGVLEIVNEIQQHYNGEEKFFVTGWSGGGNLSWWLTFRHPEKLNSIALSAANYFGFGITYNNSSEQEAVVFSTAPDRQNLPIKAFQGEKDPSLVGLSKQWEMVQKVAKTHGYNNLSRQVIAGRDHNPFAAEVIDFFLSQLPAN